MQINIGLSVCTLLAILGGGCVAYESRGETNDSAGKPISEQEETIELRRCILEQLPARDPIAKEWVVSGSTFVSAFEECSLNSAAERRALFRAVAETMVRPAEELTQLIILEDP